MTERTKMWTTIAPALIGLFGVLVGALVSTGATYWLEERKQAVDAANERSKRSVDLKVAARLVANEFLAASAATKILIEKKRWVDESIKFPLDAWERHKSVIARELSFDDWAAVEIAAQAVDNFREFHRLPRSSADASEALAEQIKPVRSDIKAGLEALGPYLDGLIEVKK